MAIPKNLSPASKNDPAFQPSVTVLLPQILGPLVVWNCFTFLSDMR